MGFTGPTQQLKQGVCGQTRLLFVTQEPIKLAISVIYSDITAEFCVKAFCVAKALIKCPN